MRPAWLADASSVDWSSYIRACAFLVGIVLIGAGLAMWLRRRYLGKQEDVFKTTGFTLKDLRRLHEMGQLTDEEFAKMKRTVVVAVKAEMEKPKPESPAAPPPPDAPPSSPPDEPPIEPPSDPLKTDNP